jgi:hypothetical protein
MSDQRIVEDARTVPTAAQIMQMAGDRRSQGPTSDRVASSKPTNPCASSLFLVTGDIVFIFSARYRLPLILPDISFSLHATFHFFLLIDDVSPI